MNTPLKGVFIMQCFKCFKFFKWFKLSNFSSNLNYSFKAALSFWFSMAKYSIMNISITSAKDHDQLCITCMTNSDCYYEIVIYLAAECRSVLRTQSNIQDGAFCKNKWRFLAVSYFRKKLQLKPSTEFCIRFWHVINRLVTS